MTIEEAQKAVEELLAQGHKKEEMAGVFYLMYQNDEIDFNEFETLCSLVEVNLTEEFKAMSEEEQKTKGWEEIDSDNDGVNDDYEDEDDDDDEEEDEEPSDEKEEAMKMYGLRR